MPDIKTKLLCAARFLQVEHDLLLFLFDLIELNLHQIIHRDKKEGGVWALPLFTYRNFSPYLIRNIFD